LKGTEIKSIREGKVNFNDAYCFFKNGELFVKGMHIAEYKMGNIFNHDPSRIKKLLLTKKELLRIKQKIEEKGLTVVPVRLFINNKGLAKLEIAVAKGKKLHDKRQSIKEREYKRSLNKRNWHEL
jgi:SsrA-binding protein